MKITLKQVKDLGEKIGINWKTAKFTPAQFKKGLLEEGTEHKDVTKGNMKTAAKLVVPHLKKTPKYYDKLEKMEGEK